MSRPGNFSVLSSPTRHCGGTEGGSGRRTSLLQVTETVQAGEAIGPERGKWKVKSKVVPVVGGALEAVTPKLGESIQQMQDSSRDGASRLEENS